MFRIPKIALKNLISEGFADSLSSTMGLVIAAKVLIQGVPESVASRADYSQYIAKEALSDPEAYTLAVRLLLDITDVEALIAEGYDLPVELVLEAFDPKDVTHCGLSVVTLDANDAHQYLLGTILFSPYSSPQAVQSSIRFMLLEMATELGTEDLFKELCRLLGVPKENPEEALEVERVDFEKTSAMPSGRLKGLRAFMANLRNFPGYLKGIYNAPKAD